MAEPFDGACYVRFMVRPRWPDVVIVVGIVALLGAGVWALWWDDLRRWWDPPTEEVDEATHGGGLT